MQRMPAQALTIGQSLQSIPFFQQQTVQQVPLQSASLPHAQQQITQDQSREQLNRLSFKSEYLYQATSKYLKIFI